ncbi:HVSL domain-containing protein [Phanerochaete sordida]|uniref:U6 snRNA phosphodiesterase 1 n=1 Tax=Phanerochaete sordida TaxID=48140 RepID=A0A9P3GDH6_9APHY|nr:HVSL domain-containing protein [Phanerochaete sordida]
MKRSGALVDYASSEDDEEQAPVVQPAAKKRKLPALASNLVVPAPVDNPALHQGRIRSSPHVEGQFAAYVYVPVQMPRGSALRTLLDNALRHGKEAVPILHAIGDAEQGSDERELHVSLTRPVYLRAHQREEFRTAVRSVSRKHTAFPASFANFAELTNDERTRTFLTMEVGAGHRELEALCSALAPTLRTYRQKEFYDKPRFHASIAWALLAQTGPAVPKSAPPPTDSDADDHSHPPQEAPSSVANGVRQEGSTVLLSATPDGFPTIPCFPKDLISSLEEEFGSSLRSRHVGAFDAEYVCIKIGKDVYKFRLQSESSL